MRQRVMSLILAVVMILSIFSSTVLAADAVQADSSVMKIHVETMQNGIWIEEAVTEWNQSVFGSIQVRFCLHGANDSVQPIDPEDMTFPDFVEVNSLDADGWCILDMIAVGTGVVSYGEYTVKLASILPDLGLYSGMPFDGNTLMDAVTIREENQVFYIALRADLIDSGSKMTQVSTQFGPEVTGTNLLKIGSVELSADGSYAKVTVNDLTAEGHHHFEATVENDSNGPSGIWGRSVHINNDMPKLYFCGLMRNQEEWLVDTAYPNSRLWCVPGYSHLVCFYFGSLSEIQNGTVEALSINDLSFPAYMTVTPLQDSEREIPENAIDIKINRFETATESTDIVYQKNDTAYPVSAAPMLPEIGFYTSPEARKSTYIYEENPFVVTETNRTFYLCPDDPDEIKVSEVTTWHNSNAADLFTVTPSTDVSGEADGRYLTVTVRDDQVVSDGYLSAEIEYQYQRNGKWTTDTNGAQVCLKNGQPTLMYQYMEWDEETESWYESDRKDLQTRIAMRSDNRSYVRFYYGTSEEHQPVEINSLSFPNDVLKGYLENGMIMIEAVGFEGTGVITYQDPENPQISARMQVMVEKPDFGFYSSAAGGKDAYLGEEVLVTKTSDSFYVVADTDFTILGVDSIRSSRLNADMTDCFTIQVDPKGRYVSIQMKEDADGNLPAGGEYNLQLRQTRGTRYLHFELIRGDLQQLSTPTELSWHKRYEWNAQNVDEYESRMGSMSFKAGQFSQNRYEVEIYSAADNYVAPVNTRGWGFGDMNLAQYFSVSDFIYAELESGTYKFRVRAEGDGTVYRDSDWSTLSPAWTYTAPADQLIAPGKDDLTWERSADRYLATWIDRNQAGAGYYEVNFFYENQVTGQKQQSGGSFDIGIRDREDGELGEIINNTVLHDEIIEEHGNVPYYFRVRVIPADITRYRVSAWSDYSAALDTTKITDVINGKLDSLIPASPTDQKPTVQQVQDTLENDTADLRTAMAADLSVSGGTPSGTLDLIKELESAVSDNVDQEIEAKNNAPDEIKEIASGIEMIGATLNLADKHPETGKSARVTLVIDEPKSGTVIAEQQHNAVQFSMKLNGAVNHDDQEQASQQLIVPIVIDMPVPESINPDFLVVLHKLANGSIEQMRPYIYWSDTESRYRATFVIDSFSDFALVEYDFGFEVDSVAKTTNDTAFAITATGNAAGSQVTYSSSDPSVAEVDPVNGTVTILKAGAVTITATAAATDVYPEAQDCYTLTITEDSTSQNGNQQGGIPNYTSPDSDKSSVSSLGSVIHSEETKNGTVTLSDASAAPGSTVTITVTPEEGFTLAELIVLNRDGKELELTQMSDGTYTFQMPSGEVSVKAVFEKIKVPAFHFTDVAEDEYYTDAVLWAVEKGITSGVGDGSQFDPNAACTRAQVVTFLWRAAGCPTPKNTVMPFTDVDPDAYYYDAVLWAIENGITSGTEDGTTFSADAPCTRAQIVTFLWRAQGSPVVSGASEFRDVTEDAYYTSAVLWAVRNSITNGTGDGSTFNPDDHCTRAQIVTFLYRSMSEK